MSSNSRRSIAEMSPLCYNPPAWCCHQHIWQVSWFVPFFVLLLKETSWYCHYCINLNLCSQGHGQSYLAPIKGPLFPVEWELDEVKANIASKIKNDQEVKDVRIGSKTQGPEIEEEGKSVFRPSDHICHREGKGQYIRQCLSMPPTGSLLNVA